MASAPRGGVTAHITHVAQDQDRITTLVMTEAQVLELVSLLTTALREKAMHSNGYRIAIWKDIPVKECQATPPCEGGAGMVNLVRPRKKPKS